MNLDLQREIHLGIYSIDYLLKCSVIEFFENVLKLSPISGKTDMFRKYDPVVLITNAAGNIDTTAADVVDIDKGSSRITLFTRDEDVPEERRVFERYPASLEVSARKKYSNKRLQMIVKNISLYGMGVVSHEDLEAEELIDIDLITDRNMFYFSGKVVWKKPLDGIFDYGLQLTHYDVATKYLFQEYLTRQKMNYSNMIPKAR
jgi:hypothetical protein